MGLKNKNNKKAFTLAEVLVVLLILSIITAAFLPLMTRRRKTVGPGSVDLWKFVTGITDIYYGDDALGVQDAIMGLDAFAVGDTASRVLISTNALGDNHILFKQGGNMTGRLLVDGQGNVGLGDVNFHVAMVGDGTNAVAIGKGAYAAATDATAIGYNAGNAAGYYSVVMGSNSYTSSACSVVIGKSATAYNTGYHVVVGDGATASGSKYDIALGSRATASANYSIAIGGSDTVGNATTSAADYNIAIGYKANNQDSRGVIIGPFTKSNSGSLYTTAIGAYAVNAGGAGAYTTAVGYNAAKVVGSGGCNTAIGSQALAKTTSGTSNTGIGYNALNANTTGSYNLAIGSGAGSSLTTTSHNTIVGYQALALGSSNNNTSIGYLTMNGGVSGSDNTAVGYQACKNLSTSTKVICIGSGADVGVGGSFEDNSIIVGYNAKEAGSGGNGIAIGATATTSTGGVIIGYGSSVTSNRLSAVAIGYGASVTGDNGVAISNGNGATAAANQIVLGPTASPLAVVFPGTLTIGTPANAFIDSAGTWTTSDRRLKNVKGEFTGGLDKIRELQPYNFTFKKDNKKTPLVGVMAQDLQKVFPDAVTKGEKGYLMIRQEDMFYAMINSIKQLDKMVQNLINGLKTVNTQIQKFDDKIIAFVNTDQIKVKRIKELEADNKEIEARLAKLEKTVK